MVNAIEDYQITGGREEVNNAVDYIQEAVSIKDASIIAFYNF